MSSAAACVAPRNCSAPTISPWRRSPRRSATAQNQRCRRHSSGTPARRRGHIAGSRRPNNKGNIHRHIAKLSERQLHSARLDSVTELDLCHASVSGTVDSWNPPYLHRAFQGTGHAGRKSLNARSACLSACGSHVYGSSSASRSYLHGFGGRSAFGTSATRPCCAGLRSTPPLGLRRYAVQRRQLGDLFRVKKSIRTECRSREPPRGSPLPGGHISPRGSLQILPG